MIRGMAAAGKSERLLNLLIMLLVQRHYVAVQHPVAERGEPQGIPSRPAAYVGHGRGRRRQVPGDDLPGPRGLQLAGRLIKPIPLPAALVVLEHRRRCHVISHGQ